MAHLSYNVETYIETRPVRPGSRSRTTSFMSTSSGASLGSTITEISKSSSTSSLSQRPDKHIAYGSFVPVRSAANTLRNFVGCSTLTRPPRRRKVTFDDKRTTSFTYDVDSDESSYPDVPYITRTFPLTPQSSAECPPSSTSSPSTSTRITHLEIKNVSELHPILAKMERQSRLCGIVVQCTTCGKKGSDFPRCPRCGDVWCSRPCRLVGGKRHVCNEV